MEIQKIAEVCHAAHQSYRGLINETPQDKWDNLKPERQAKLVQAVYRVINHPDITQQAQHGEWVKCIVKYGWKYGEVYDEGKKEHPCILPYSLLPENQKKKDALFLAIVNALMAKKP